MKRYITYVFLDGDMDSFSMYANLEDAKKEASEYGKRFDTYTCVCELDVEKPFNTLNCNELNLVWENVT